MSDKGNGKIAPKVETSVKRFQNIVDKESGEVLVHKCIYCGKTLTAENAIEENHGSYCEDLRKAGWTHEKLLARKAELTVASEEELEALGYTVRVPDLNKICRKNGLSISWMVRAFGGDRGVLEPIHEKFTPRYFKRVRYLHADCATDWGLKMIASVGKRKKEAEQVDDTLAEMLTK